MFAQIELFSFQRRFFTFSFVCVFERESVCLCVRLLVFLEIERESVWEIMLKSFKFQCRKVFFRLVWECNFFRHALHPSPSLPIVWGTPKKAVTPVPKIPWTFENRNKFSRNKKIPFSNYHYDRRGVPPTTQWAEMFR